MQPHIYSTAAPPSSTVSEQHAGSHRWLAHSCTLQALAHGFLPLALMTLQTCVPILIRISHKDTKERTYSPALLTMYAEIAKWAVCMLCISHHSQGTLSLSRTLRRWVKSLGDMAPLVWPALLFFLSNILTIYSLTYLRSYVFAAIMNARIIFAAALSAPFLDKSLTLDQWRAVVVIFCATTLLCSEIIQSTANQTSPSQENATTPSTLPKEKSGKIVHGTLLGLCNAAVSAAGGVLIEKYLRSARNQHEGPSGPDMAAHARTVWEQQAALACFSAGLGVIYVPIVEHPDGWQAFAPLNWDALVVFIMVLQATLGIVVALAIKKFGIVARLVLGSLSMCLCIVRAPFWRTRAWSRASSNCAGGHGVQSVCPTAPPAFPHGTRPKPRGTKARPAEK